MPRRNGLSIPSPRSGQRRPVDDEAAKLFEAKTEAKGAGITELYTSPIGKEIDGVSGSAVPEPNEPDLPQVSQPEPARNRRGTLRRPHIRKDGVATKSTAFHLPVDLVKRLRVAAAISGSTQSSIAEAAINAWLENHPNG